jgi:Ni2+-binding GTPase involved in maturation of urease and hydrogenase
MRHKLLCRTRSAREHGRTNDAGGVAVFTGVRRVQNEFVSSVGTGGHTVLLEQKLENLKSSTNISITASDTVTRQTKQSKVFRWA